MQPHAHISELHSKVQAACGVGGRFWPVPDMSDCVKVKPLQFESTMQECGLFHNAVVWLEQEDGFSADKDALIALQEACMKRSRYLPSWLNLKSFTSPEQLATCDGVVEVCHGRVTALELIGCGLTGNISQVLYQYPCLLMTVFGQGHIPTEIGNLKSLRKLSLSFNQLEGEKHGVCSVVQF
jgi:hypothetical protein